MRCISWILPIDVDAVEAQVREEVHGAAGEGFAPARGGCWRGEVGTVSPAADGEEGFEVAVLLFQEVELLDAAVGVGAGLGPTVVGVVLFEVGVGVC